MGGIYLSDRNIQDYIIKKDPWGIHEYLCSKPVDYINTCYAYLGGMYIPCRPVYNALAYAAAQEDFTAVKVMLMHGACFDEAWHPFKGSNNAITTAKSPFMRNHIVLKILERLKWRKKIHSGACTFYSPIKAGLRQALSELYSYGGDGPGPFLVSALADAIASDDGAGAGRILSSFREWRLAHNEK